MPLATPWPSNLMSRITNPWDTTGRHFIARGCSADSGHRTTGRQKQKMRLDWKGFPAPLNSQFCHFQVSFLNVGWPGLCITFLISPKVSPSWNSLAVTFKCVGLIIFFSFIFFNGCRMFFHWWQKLQLSAHVQRSSSALLSTR